MSDLEIRVADAPAEASPGWSAGWADRRRGIARLSDGERSLLVLVEGGGSSWVVTLRGRRIPVTVRTWRERVLAEAGTAAAPSGPTQVTASLPGLVVAVVVTPGDEVEAGAPLLTIEAMKMQNEVRAPRAGRVVEVAVAAGATVVTGAPLVRLE